MSSEQIAEYFQNKIIGITKENEESILTSKNTGRQAEDYVGSILSIMNIGFVKQKKIKCGESYIIPDFYIPNDNLVIEVKSRSYFVSGTASEKIDHIPRKYSKIERKKLKVLVVFCANEINYQKELIEISTDYLRDFCKLAKKYGVIGWISVADLIGTLQEISITTRSIPKPFVKWAGGKSKIHSIILSEFPKQYRRYHEPFVGGGAIAWRIDKDIEKTIADTNASLVNCYNIIKKNHIELIKELSQSEYVYDKTVFLQKRMEFNSYTTQDVKKAALFIYLNKCCFNGLYRENKNGEFNVPFGNMKNVNVCDTAVIMDCHDFLQNVDISTSDFLLSDPNDYEPGDLLYLDPPYHKTFTNYTAGGFGEYEQMLLRDIILKLKPGVFVMISNSDTKFIRELYSGFNLIEINTKYSIGNTDRSKNKMELLIKNF